MVEQEPGIGLDQIGGDPAGAVAFAEQDPSQVVLLDQPYAAVAVPGADLAGDGRLPGIVARRTVGGRVMECYVCTQRRPKGTDVLIEIEGEGVYRVPEADGERIRRLAGRPGATGSDIEKGADEVRRIGTVYTGRSAPDLVLTTSRDSIPVPVEGPNEVERGSPWYGPSTGPSTDTVGLPDIEDTDRGFG